MLVLYVGLGVRASLRSLGLCLAASYHRYPIYRKSGCALGALLYNVKC